MFDKIKALFGKPAAATPPDPLTAEITALLDQLVADATAGTTPHAYAYDQLQLGTSPAYRDLKKRPDAFKAAVLLVLVGRILPARAQHHDRSLAQAVRDQAWAQAQVWEKVLDHLLRSAIALRPADYETLLRAFGIIDEQARRLKSVTLSDKWLATLLHLQRFGAKDGLPEDLRPFLTNYQAILGERGQDSPLRQKARKLLEELLRPAGTSAVAALTLPTDAFGQQLAAFVQTAPSNAEAWAHLLGLWLKASGAKPTQKFLTEAGRHLAAIGPDAFRAAAHDWLTFVGKLGPTAVTTSSSYTYHVFLSEPSLALAKGLVWTLPLLPAAEPETLRLLAALVENAYRKIPGQGPMAAGLGNAALGTLAQGGLPGVAHLSRLRLRVRQSNTQDLIDRLIQEASARLGVSAAEVEDMAVPDFDLTDGTASFELAGYRATLHVEATGVDVALHWQKPDGGPLKSVPAAVKQHHAAELKALKATLAQAQQMLSAQRDRLDRAFVADRRWTYAQFATYYLHHGLLAPFTRTLIWRFEWADGRTADAAWFEGRWSDAHGQPAAAVEEADHVRLWHPVLSAAAEVLAWRELFERHQRRQPLKQAYREVYLLTAAEENTRTYSNRMAAHLLKQHQFNSLAKLRGWKYSLLGAYDDGRDGERARLLLPDHQLRAEFWVNEVNADDAFNDTGIWHYVSTDQVRFCPLDSDTPVPLDQVPQLVFSEVMRDVDLFVGVASVGNDPQWRDSGGLPAYRDYWQHYSFGELGEVAKTRKAVLERLVPRLRIAKVSEVRDRFLVVRGQLRTYKIHLGSGNILMEPNDQYLCIVPDRSKPTDTGVFLPFEGDAVLSIILSKAFLLAADDRITDSTITRQIR